MSVYSITKYASFAALTLIFVGLPAYADDAVTQIELQALRKELRALKHEVKRLESIVARIDEKAVTSTTVRKVTKLRLDSSRILGNPEARVGIIEFSDYQCPL